MIALTKARGVLRARDALGVSDYTMLTLRERGLLSAATVERVRAKLVVLQAEGVGQ